MLEQVKERKNGIKKVLQKIWYIRQIKERKNGIKKVLQKRCTRKNR